MRRVLILAVFCIGLPAALMAPVWGASASSETAWPEATPAEPPKPLTAVPNAPSALPPDGSKIDPGSGLPQNLTELRAKNRADFKAWFKDDQEVLKQCASPQGPAERAQCDLKKKASQAKYDVIHARMLEILRKIDFWRRKQAGLPPPDWWPPENQPITQPNAQPNSNNASPNVTTPKKENSTLLPSDAAPLPANTF
jgi:hypothetical protein